MNLIRVFIGLIFWKMVFCPSIPYAQQMIHMGNSQVGSGYSRIVVDFEVRGEVKQVELLKRCVFFERNTGNGVKDIYGLWLDGRNAVDYVSEDNWGFRIEFNGNPRELNGSQCVRESEIPRVLDWTAKPSKFRGAGVRWESEVRNEASYANVLFVDDLSDPDRIERFYRYYHWALAGFPENTVIDEFKINKITISYCNLKSSRPIASIYNERLDVISRNSGLITYSALALTKEDWGKNKFLASILSEIKIPTPIDPAIYPELDCFYQENENRESFPKKGTACGLDHKYFVYGVHPALDVEGVWDVRELSLSLARFRMPKFSEGNYDKGARIIDGPFSKFKAGNYVFDLKNYREILVSKDRRRAQRLWFYDPHTELLISFMNLRV